MDSAVRRRRGAGAIAVVAVIAFAMVLRSQLGGAYVVRVVDDLGEAIAAGIGAFACIWRATQAVGRWRLSWALFGGALASWTAGELVWSYYELISSRETPFPSLADVGYLLFPALALPGLLVRPATAFAGRGRLRVVLDGTMVAASLFILSWSSSLGAVYHAGAQNRMAFVVSLAYPVSDIIMVSVAILVALQMRVQLGPLFLVIGLVSMAVADSAFAYMTAAGTYHTGAFSDVAWVAAFLMIGVSALYPHRVDDVAPMGVEAPLTVALPYVLVLGGATAEVTAIVQNNDAAVTLIVEAAALVALLIRQLITVLDNRRLAVDLLARQAELRFRAFHDALTGLANRALFYDRVVHALELHNRDMRPVSVMFVDLDDFKSVNDAFGHHAGDIVLTAVAERLLTVVRTGDTVARLGGDEFAILVEDDGDVAILAERLQSTLSDPVAIDARTIPVRASIGTTTLDPAEGQIGIHELLKRADLAMYSAKRSGKGTSVSYSSQLRADADGDLDQRLSLADDIRSGLVRTAFQPIVWADGRPYALEALARWRYRGADMPTHHFIPLADRAGLLPELDMLMMRNALSRLTTVRSWHENVRVSVNVGLDRIYDGKLGDRISAMITEFAFPPRDLIVEVVETDALDDARTLDTFAALREIGVSIAVDDFGVGYSNLSRLGRLQPDIVKLDMSFVEPLKQSDASTRLLAGVIALAHDLGAIVIGEGVETERQFEALNDLGCDAMQGFLIGAPVIAAAPDTPLVPAPRVVGVRKGLPVSA